MQMKHPSKSETSRNYFETPMKHPIVKEKVYTPEFYSCYAIK